MEFPEPLLLDEELENQCNEIRAIASKVCFVKIMNLITFKHIFNNLLVSEEI